MICIVFVFKLYFLYDYFMGIGIGLLEEEGQ